MAAERMKFTMEDAQIIFRNFAGNEQRYNDRGDRNFVIVIPNEKVAKKMEKDGWAVKYRENEQDGEVTIEPQLKVKVSYKFRAPTVIMLDSMGHRTRLTEDMLEVLDYADITNVDLICTGSHWVQPDGKNGVSAYLQSIYVTVQEDELERKYALLEDEEQHG